MNQIENHFFDLHNNRLSGAVSSANIYTTPVKGEEMEVTVGNEDYTIIPFGSDNQLPYTIKRLIENNSVMSQNKLFNLLTCYGRGLEYMDIETMGGEKPTPTREASIKEFLLRNQMKKFFAEQIVDIKRFYFSVAVIILNNNRDKIVKLVHKDACHCRFEKADSKGNIKHVLYADWENDNSPEYIEVIPLLDEQDPLGDLLARTGKERDKLGFFKADNKRQKKYAIVCRMPTCGSHYYPIPDYTAVFRDGWYDIYGLLTAAKKAKIKNGQSIRYHVEINQTFWDRRAANMGISAGTQAYTDMKTDFLNGLKENLSGNTNSDKLVWSEFLALVDGKEQHDLKITTVDTSKAGNEYNDDVAEASNVLCYDDNVHPNLAGATPGKSQMNNSGSDKRELFTMKQVLETLPHDIMMAVHNTVIYFNGWQDKVEPVVPLIMLTTLDKNTDAKEVDTNNNQNNNDGNC